MTAQQIETADILLRYAKADLRLAKKQSQLAIVGTKIGNVEIEYFIESDTYQASNFNSMSTKHTKKISAKEMAFFIASIYVLA